MTRFIGACLCALACVAVGVCLTREEDKRVRQCEAMLALVRHIRAQIAHYRTPRERLADGFHDETLESAGLLPLLREGKTLAQALTAASDQLYFSEEEMQLLVAFAEGIGGYARECDARCAECEKTLSTLCEERRRERPRRTSLLCTGCVSFGLILLLILV